MQFHDKLTITYVLHLTYFVYKCSIIVIYIYIYFFIILTISWININEYSNSLFSGCDQTLSSDSLIEMKISSQWIKQGGIAKTKPSNPFHQSLIHKLSFFHFLSWCWEMQLSVVRLSSDRDLQWHEAWRDWTDSQEAFISCSLFLNGGENNISAHNRVNSS